jgi:hypothetical protein
LPDKRYSELSFAKCEAAFSMLARPWLALPDARTIRWIFAGLGFRGWNLVFCPLNSELFYLAVSGNWECSIFVFVVIGLGLTALFPPAENPSPSHT